MNPYKQWMHHEIHCKKKAFKEILLECAQYALNQSKIEDVITPCFMYFLM